MDKVCLFQYHSSLSELQLRLSVDWTFVSHLGKIVCEQQLLQKSNLFPQLRRILKSKSKTKKTILNLIHGIVKVQELFGLNNAYPSSTLSPLCRLKNHHSICMKLLQNKILQMVTVDLNLTDHQHTTSRLLKKRVSTKISCNFMKKSFILPNQIKILKNLTRDYKSSWILHVKRTNS